MAEAAASALSVLQSQACLSAAPCKWAAGAGMQQLLDKAKKSGGRQGSEAARAFDGAAYISGPVLSRQQQLEAALDLDKWVGRPALEALVGKAAWYGWHSKPSGVQPSAAWPRPCCARE